MSSGHNRGPNGQTSNAQSPKPYFGQNSIRPDFLRAQEAEIVRTAPQPTQKPKQLEQTPNQAINQAQTENQPTNQPQTSKKAKKLKKLGPLAALLVTLGLTGATFFIPNSFLSPHLYHHLTEATDLSLTSRNARLIRRLQTHNLTDYAKNRLAKNGITTSDDNFEYNGKTISKADLETELNHNSTFREAFTKSTRGRAANFFDTNANYYYKKLNLSRNLLNNYRLTGDDATDEANYHKTLSDYFGHGTDTDINTAEDRPVLDEDGNEVKNEDGTTKTERAINGEDAKSSSQQGDTARAKAESYVANLSRKVADSGGLACAALKVGNMLAVAVAANDLYNSIHYFMVNGAESDSRVRVGEGNSSGVNSHNNALYKTETITVTDPDTGEEVELTGAPLEEEALQFILGDTKIDQNETKYFSLERPFITTTTAIASHGLTTATCTTLNVAGAALSLSTALAGGVFVRATVGLLLNTVVGTGMQHAIMGIIGVMIPVVAQSMFSNFFEDVKGLEIGARTVQGASAANQRLYQSASGAMPTERSRILSYTRENQKTLAQEAELDRQNKSPFDISSKNTFLGSLARTFSFIGQNPLKNLPKSTASALSEGETYLSTFCENCPVSAEYNMEADVFGITIVTSDLSTVDIPDDDPTYRQLLEENLKIDEAGSETVKPGSKLAAFINFGTQRQSPWGVYDANIISTCQTDFRALEYLPLIEDVVDIVNAIEEAKCKEYATGEYFFNSSSNPHWDEEVKYFQKWYEDVRIRDQLGEYAEQQNPVTAYLNSWDQAHPADTSEAGILSAISGLPKEDTETILALIEYQDFLANYHPEDRVNFNRPERGPQYEKPIAFVPTYFWLS